LMMTRTESRLSVSQILSNREICPGYFRMRIACDPLYQDAMPGQFVMVRGVGQTSPLLRRPFSIHDLIIEGERVTAFDILYKIIGKGTEALSRSGAGDMVDVLGPLGRGFSTRGDFRHVHMVAGGIGVAPLVFLINHLMRQGLSNSQITLFVGGRSCGDLLCLEIFEGLGIQLAVTTDDGSAGSQCLVTQPLGESLRRQKPEILFACGPMPMLREVVAISIKDGIPCQISIETMMACGMGACLGCAVEKRDTKEKYLHACMDGPVFEAGQIIL
jgi:dihydroorotate dehydrogenase electron transfer subunit